MSRMTTRQAVRTEVAGVVEGIVNTNGTVLHPEKLRLTKPQRPTPSQRSGRHRRAESLSPHWVRREKSLRPERSQTWEKKGISGDFFALKGRFGSNVTCRIALSGRRTVSRFSSQACGA